MKHVEWNSELLLKCMPKAFYSPQSNNPLPKPNKPTNLELVLKEDIQLVTKLRDFLFQISQNNDTQNSTEISSKNEQENSQEKKNFLSENFQVLKSLLNESNSFLEERNSFLNLAQQSQSEESFSDEDGDSIDEENHRSEYFEEISSPLPRTIKKEEN